jgi:hypothetical protein
MLEANTNKPQGPRYRKAIAKWFRVHDEDEVFSAIDKADRSRLLKCFDNLAALSYWRDILMSPEQRLKVTYPPTVFSRWLAWGKNQTGVEQSEGDEPPPDPLPKPELAVVVSGMTDDELRKQLPIAIPFDRFLRVLPLDWRAKIEARLSRRPHAETAEAFIKASEVLRRALSLVKVADAPRTTPPIAASNEKEALAALRGLNTILVGVGIDEVTIVHQHAKERRCGKQRRRRTA